MPVCAICLGPDPDTGHYHRACLEALFGAPELPALDLDLATFPSRVEATHDRMSVSGVQRKALLHLSGDRRELQLATAGADSTFILKPQTERFGSLPENEHVSMLVGRELGLVTPDFGLIQLRDGSWAYIVRRFDRADTPPHKRQQFDFCQLLGRPPEKKAIGSAEECAELVRAHTADPPVALRQLFLLFLTSFWIGNADLHLKNISLLADAEGRYALSPVYDLLSTAPYGFTHQLLGVAGRTNNLSCTHYLQLGAACALSREEVHAMIAGVRDARARIGHLVDRSFLPPNYKTNYKQTLAKRTRALRPPS